MIVDILPYADHIIVLGDGKVVDSGSYRDILTHNPDLFLASTSTEKEPEDERKLSIKEDISRSKIEKPDDQVKNKETGTMKDSVDILRRNWTWGVYQHYIHRAGPYICLAAVGVLIIQAFTAEYASESPTCLGDNSDFLTDVLWSGMAAKLVKRKWKESERSPSDVPRRIHPAQCSYAYWPRRICLVSRILSPSQFENCCH